MSTIGFVLARLGSQGIPKKNIRKLGALPLIEYTIKAALESNLDRVYLTTESDEIASVAYDSAQKYDLSRFSVVMRPDCLATSTCQSDEVLLFLLRQLQFEGINPDTVVMLQPTSPFRTAKHINEAIELYYEQVKEGLHTVVSCHVAEGFYWQIDEWNDDSIVPVRHDPVLRQGRQWIPEADKLYKENGAIYICDAYRFSLHRSYRLAPFTLYKMDERDSIDLDTLDDWERAEREMERRKNA